MVTEHFLENRSGTQSSDLKGNSYKSTKCIDLWVMFPHSSLSKPIGEKVMSYTFSVSLILW